MSCEGKKKVKWGWVIFWSIVCCPVAIYLVYDRLQPDAGYDAAGTERVLKGARTFSTIHIALGIFGIAMGFASVAEIVSAMAGWEMFSYGAGIADTVGCFVYGFVFGGGGFLIRTRIKKRRLELAAESAPSEAETA